MNIDLNEEEVIILSELLQRYSKYNVFTIEDQAEQRALWNLECALEKIELEHSDGDWNTIHKNAMSKLRDENGTNSIFEKENGRIALWLQPQEIQFIISEWHKVNERESKSVKEIWSQLAFRCNAALHKAGLK